MHGRELALGPLECIQRQSWPANRMIEFSIQGFLCSAKASCAEDGERLGNQQEKSYVKSNLDLGGEVQ